VPRVVVVADPPQIVLAAPLGTGNVRAVHLLPPRGGGRTRPPEATERLHVAPRAQRLAVRLDPRRRCPRISLDLEVAARVRLPQRQGEGNAEHAPQRAAVAQRQGEGGLAARGEKGAVPEPHVERALRAEEAGEEGPGAGGV